MVTSEKRILKVYFKLQKITSLFYTRDKNNVLSLTKNDISPAL